MADQAAKLVVRIYNYTRKTFSTIVRIFRKEVLLFRLFGIPVYLGFSFFLIGLFPFFIFVAVPPSRYSVYGVYLPARSLLSELLDLILQVPLILLAAFISVLVHELGHAFFVRRNKLRVDRIFISALYGVCRYSYPSNIVPPVSIAYGGVIAQALLSVVLSVYLSFVFPSSYDAPAYIFQFHYLLSLILLANYCMILINLLPAPGLDGQIIWAHINSLLQKKSK